MPKPPSYDYIVIGSGIAGLFAALQARQHGKVLLLTKGSIEECNTRYAQGGIAAPLGPDDSADLHLRDTLAAGAGLADPQAARILVQEAADRIDDLVRLGVPFDTVEGKTALSREGAHSLPRVLHAGGDATGAYIEITLSKLARLSNITVREQALATAILIEDGAVVGVEALDGGGDGLLTFKCRFLILATGGAGQLYKVSTNQPVATGDGIALAYQAGAEVMDMEFFQFHPTALSRPGVRSFLISEAVRGEGGLLLNLSGERFMARYHNKSELAPRDIVARAIVAEMERTGADHMLLDVTHMPAQMVTTRFPQIYRFCRENGLDITKEPIPISPAAHYTMGGVRTNVWGETTVRRLYACGEVACNAAHGANRMASNSLLETVVFARRVIRRSLESPDTVAPHSRGAIDLPPPAQAEAPEPSLEALRSLMWEDVGIVRDGQRLARARSILAAWRAALPSPIDRPSHELANLLTCGSLVTEAALLRQESRGAHYRSDFAEPSSKWQRHIVFRRGA